MKLNFLCVTVILCVYGKGGSEVLNPTTELLIYRERIKAIAQLLQELCPGRVSAEVAKFPHRRDVLSHDLRVAIERVHLNRLENLLADCHSATIETTTQNWKTINSNLASTTLNHHKFITSSVQETTTFAYPSTITVPLPSQCTSSLTKNLTEAWRSNIGGGLKPNAGDWEDDINILDGGITWFRFKGAAGTQLLNKCPLQDSCGSNGPHWSDDLMPTAVGETKTIRIYESFGKSDGSDCKESNRAATATRCSWSGDFVYRIDGKLNSEADTICGMIA